jgi:hypothetical protein
MPPDYRPPPDLAVVTCYFNPDGYRSKRENFAAFWEPLDRAGLTVAVVECVFGDGPFELSDPGVRHVRGRDVMWQKERLLNLGIAGLPSHVRKVAWLDADVLFTNPGWAADAARLLDEYPVVQLFDTAVRLPRGTIADDDRGERYPSFAAVLAREPHRLLAGDFAAHGHTGFAWAARREVLAHGLYDACIAGSGDHMMAHAFAGDWESPCVDRILGPANRHRKWFSNWGQKVYNRVRARVGCVPGTLLHLWHGAVADRRYADRNRELAGFGFDPARDVRVGPAGCWEWASRKPALHAWARRYFAGRREDGPAPEDRP